VSRIKGIGFAVAKKLAEQGADLFIHSFSPYDSQFPWKTNKDEISTIITELEKTGGRVEHIEAGRRNRLLALLARQQPNRLDDLRAVGHDASPKVTIL